MGTVQFDSDYSVEDEASPPLFFIANLSCVLGMRGRT